MMKICAFCEKEVSEFYPIRLEMLLEFPSRVWATNGSQEQVAKFYICNHCILTKADFALEPEDVDKIKKIYSNAFKKYAIVAEMSK